MIFTHGLRAPETPVALDDGSWLVVEMAHGDGGVVRVSADGGDAVELFTTGRPNGVAIDARGWIWICETIGATGVDASISRASLDGSSLEVVLDSYQGEPFKFPNDLVFGPDGALYFTDSGVTVADLEAAADPTQLEFDGGVYRYDPDSGDLLMLDSLWSANGIAWGVEDDVFYVGETYPGRISRYRVGEDGEILAKNLVGDAIDRDREQKGVVGPDGLAVAAGGDIYAAVFGQGIVAVMAPDGTIRERIETEDRQPTNVAFGLGDGKLYVTGMEQGLIEVFDLGVRGAPVRRGRS